MRAAAESGPAVIGEAIVAIFPEDEMIQERDPQQFSGLPQALSQDPIFLTWRRVSRGMIMLCDVASYVKFLRADASAPA